MEREKDDRILRLPKSCRINEEVCLQLDFLLDFATAEEYRDTLIELYHLYLLHEHQAFPEEFERMANQMYLLISFMKEFSIQTSADTESPE